MPQNTKVWRCVEKLKKKYNYDGAIAICQTTTKQNYKTGKKIKTLRKKKTIQKKKKRKNTQRKRSKLEKDKDKQKGNCEK